MYEVDLNGIPVAKCDTTEEASRCCEKLDRALHQEFPDYTGYRITVVEIPLRQRNRQPV